jgi:uncharacterized protein (DUF1697 family)
MAIRIVLLRAVNVGGATLPMAELREVAAELGATDVRTYIASGNLIADVPDDPAMFDRALEKAVEQRFGFVRDVISRTPEQVRAALEAHPFDVVKPKFSYVSFLTGGPDLRDVRRPLAGRRHRDAPPLRRGCRASPDEERHDRTRARCGRHRSQPQHGREADRPRGSLRSA